MIQHKKDANYKFLFEKKKARIESLQIKLEAMRILYTLKEREERNKTKKELKQEKQNMLQLLKHIDLCTTMKISDFLPFIISYLSSIEKKDIIAFPITQDYELEEGKSLTDKVVSRIYNYVKQKFLIKDLLIDVNETFYLICSREEAEKIKEMTKICSLYDALEKMKLREYLLIPMDFQEIHLADGIELKKEWRTCKEMFVIFNYLLEYAWNDENYPLSVEDRIKKNGLEINKILQEIKSDKFYSRKRKHVRKEWWN